MAMKHSSFSLGEIPGIVPPLPAMFITKGCLGGGFNHVTHVLLFLHTPLPGEKINNDYNMFDWVESYRSSRTSRGSHFNLNTLPLQ